MRIIAGKARGRKLLAPEGLATRPTLDRVKESMFNIIQNKVRGSIALDLFAGTGSLGLEAASRGAKECHLIDMGEDTYNKLKQNITNLKFEDLCKSYKGDAYKLLQEFSSKKITFDLIFIDPPYAKEMIPPSLEKIKKLNLLQKDGLIVTKIDSEEEAFEGYEDITLVDKRKYGNTTVCFYQYEE